VRKICLFAVFKSANSAYKKFGFLRIGSQVRGATGV
jgi:hypothetical protein